MSTETAASVPGEVVFVGACRLTGGKLGSAFLPLDYLDRLGIEDVQVVERNSSPFDIKPNLVVGGVYAATVVREGDRIKRIGAREYLRRVDHVLVPFWEIAHKAAELEKAREGLERKARANPVVMGEVEALGALYYRARSSERPLFENVIIDLVRQQAGKMSAERIAANAESLGLGRR